MEFCEKCGNLLVVERIKGKLKWTCRKCGTTSKKKKAMATTVTEKLAKGEEKIPIFDENEDLKQYPVTKIKCPKCGNIGAFWFLQQTRAADEAQTMFLCCTKCKHKWREY